MCEGTTPWSPLDVNFAGVHTGVPSTRKVRFSSGIIGRCGPCLASRDRWVQKQQGSQTARPRTTPMRGLGHGVDGSDSSIAFRMSSIMASIRSTANDSSSEICCGVGPPTMDWSLRPRPKSR